MRVVIAHDFLETYGGAERVTEEIARAFPEATVHALLARPSVVERMGIADRFHSVLPARSRILEHYRLGAPALPYLTDSVRLPEADVLITSSYAFAHRFRTVNDAPQICYCHSPLRFAWSMTESYRDDWTRSRLSRAAFTAFAAHMRRSDRRAAQRGQTYVTSCRNVARQIERCLGQPAHIIGAPIDTERFRPAAGESGPDDYFLFCGRLIEPYKRVGITVEAFRRLGRKLLVVGDGPAMRELRRTAPPNAELVGSLRDDELVEVMQRCQAAIFPSKDDLGLLPLEVMACGRPVLAYAGGGALESVREGVTGQFFHEQTADAIAEGVREFDPDSYDPEALRSHALGWSTELFRRRLVEQVHEAALPA